jgi:enoyl-CoA hydratase/carnithine racemase
MTGSVAREQARDTSEPLIAVDDVPLAHGVLRVLVLNRPAKRNALNLASVLLLRDLVVAAHGDERVRCLCVTGAGTAFSGGGDLAEFRTLHHDAAGFDEYLTVFADVCSLIESGPLPAIAAVNGSCVAGGLELALAFDWVLASADARIGDGHLRFAQLPGAGGVARLCRRVGVPAARDLLLTARLCDAREAAELGLVDGVVPPGDLMAGVVAIAEQVAEHSTHAMAGMKAMIATTLAAADGPLLAERAVAERYASTDSHAQEGIAAFRERRSPRFDHG